MRRTVGMILCLVCAVACRNAAAPGTAHKLKSGRNVKVLGMTRIQFPDSGPALMLRYETDIDMADITRLHEEAVDIWSKFKIDAENARVRDAIVSAVSVPSGGIIQHSRTVNFTFSKGLDGQWRETGSAASKKGPENVSGKAPVKTVKE